ncbi:MAG: ABC transporter substrate-binding protein, partial [Alkalibacterium sp.]
MNRKRMIKWGLSFSLMFLAACSDSQANETNDLDQQNDEATEQVETDTDTEENQKNIDFVVVEDAAGNSVEVPFDPQRVAVFDNGQLDNMAAIGMEDRVVVTASPNLPAHLSQYNDVEVAGSFFEIDLEVTHAADPDLIIVAGRSSAAYDDLSAIAPTIDLSHDAQNYLDSIGQNLSRYAEFFAIEDQVAEITNELEEKLKMLNEKAENSDVTTLMTMYNEGSLSAYGEGSRYGVIYDAFGFKPVDDEIESTNHGMEISNEYLLSENPDVI